MDIYPYNRFRAELILHNFTVRVNSSLDMQVSQKSFLLDLFSRVLRVSELYVVDADEEGLQAPPALLLAVVLRRKNVSITMIMRSPHLKVQVKKVWKKLKCKVSMFRCTILAYSVNCKEKVT